MKLLACLLLALVGLPGAAVAQDLVIGVRSAPLSIDPHFNSNGPDTSASRNVFDALTRRGPDFELLPNLATSWSRVGDALWEFKLREGVKWHDGRPFTARDVVFSIERVPVAKGSAGGFVPYVRAVKRAYAVDDLTVRIETDGPALTLPAELEEVFIVSEQAVTAAGADGFQTGAAAIGTGPYRLVSWKQNQSEVLERWNGYWGQKPFWQKVIINEIAVDSSRIAALLSGQVDLINYVPPAGVESLLANAKIGVAKTNSIFVYLMQLDGRETTPLIWDNDGKPLPRNPLRDIRVRTAISLAVNRDAIARITMEGLATPARHVIPLSFAGVDRDAPALPYDPAEGRRLMAEAGYPNGFKLRLTCTNNRLPNDALVCAALAPMLNRIGIQVEVAALPQAVYFPDFTRGAYSLSMSGFGLTTGDAGSLLGSLAFTRDKDPNFGQYNRARYSNAEVDRITKAAMDAGTAEDRLALVRQGMALVLADRGYIPVVNLSAVWAYDAAKLRYVAQTNEDTVAAAAVPP